MRCVMWDTHVRLLRETTHNSNTLCCAACFMSTDIHLVSYPVFLMYQVDTGMLKISIKSFKLLNRCLFTLKKSSLFMFCFIFVYLWLDASHSLQDWVLTTEWVWGGENVTDSHPAGGGGGCLGRPSIWWLNPAPGTPYHNVGRKMFREINSWQNVVFIQ